MPLPTALNTNEVKNSAGTEVEFVRQDGGTGRKLVYQQVAETPNAPHRITFSHAETGSGADLVRRSLSRVDKTVTGVSGKPRIISFYEVGVIPVGDISTLDEVKNVQAELISLVASTGADTVVKFDCTGTAAAAVVNGTL